MELMNDLGPVSCFCLWKEQGLEGKETEVKFTEKSIGLGEAGRWAREGGPMLTLGRSVVPTSARLLVVGLGWG